MEPYFWTVFKHPWHVSRIKSMCWNRFFNNMFEGVFVKECVSQCAENIFEGACLETYLGSI